MSSIPGDFAINGCRCADSECEHRQETILEFPKKKFKGLTLFFCFI